MAHGDIAKQLRAIQTTRLGQRRASIFPPEYFARLRRPATQNRRRFAPGEGSGGQLIFAREPLFEKRGRFRAFYSPANRVHYAAAQAIPASIKAEPIRQMQFTRLAVNFQ